VFVRYVWLSRLVDILCRLCSVIKLFGMRMFLEKSWTFLFFVFRNFVCFFTISKTISRLWFWQSWDIPNKCSTHDMRTYLMTNFTWTWCILIRSLLKGFSTLFRRWPIWRIAMAIISLELFNVFNRVVLIRSVLFPLNIFFLIAPL